MYFDTVCAIEEKMHVQFDFFVSLILSYLFYNILDIINVDGIKKSECMITTISNSHTMLSANSCHIFYIVYDIRYVFMRKVRVNWNDKFQ